MPVEWLKPEVALEYKGHKIYHTYKDDDPNNRRQFWYTTDPQAVDGFDNFCFDIRDFDFPPEYDSIKSRLSYLIDNNIITFPNYFVS